MTTNLCPNWTVPGWLEMHPQGETRQGSYGGNAIYFVLPV